jgi:hypothetical protein
MKMAVLWVVAPCRSLPTFQRCLLRRNNAEYSHLMRWSYVYRKETAFINVTQSYQIFPAMGFLCLVIDGPSLKLFAVECAHLCH